MAKRGGVAARNYVLHIDPSASWSKASSTNVSLVSGRESSRVRCGRPSGLVNRVGTGTYGIEELCRKCWASAERDANAAASSGPDMARRSATGDIAVVHVAQSPMNPKRWCATLACNHEVWMTAAKRPMRKALPCSVCKAVRP